MDKRIEYTQKTLKNTFLSLLEKKDITNITVSEICTEAGINRGTFYRYYKYLSLLHLFSQHNELNLF